MATTSQELKVVTLLAAVVAITSTIQAAIQGMNYYHTTILPPTVIRIFLTLLFWTAIIFIFVALNMYRKL